ncbi:trypsin-like serine peptidase [Kutzneria albida]|uniref:Peptidase S1 domain-containing protein n=1 Tax=Kutzneria albida DSM 43870 TaxID=1449976 RepID=W5WQZ7_9PSEU|nr:hypothetical protein KALB_7252 [Kutzneria albida DSM 43870]
MSAVTAVTVLAGSFFLVSDAAGGTDPSQGVHQVSEAEANESADQWDASRTVSPTSVPAAVPNGLNPVVGALFSVDANGDNSHFCSGSVVHSPAGNLVVTAAHCLHDGAGGRYNTKITFVPGYHDGQAPFGVWEPVRMVVAQGWLNSSDPDLDVGFMTVREVGGSRQVEDVTGANLFGANHQLPTDVQVSGYPDESDRQLSCRESAVRFSSYQMRFSCPGYTDGTSGSPWVTNRDATSGLGTVIGVIGGHDGGGDTADVSYSTYFDEDIARLYELATA